MTSCGLRRDSRERLLLVYSAVRHRPIQNELPYQFAIGVSPDHPRGAVGVSDLMSDTRNFDLVMCKYLV